MRLKDVIDKLLFASLVSSSPHKPGIIIEKHLTKEERELLKKATAKDFNHRQR